MSWDISKIDLLSELRPLQQKIRPIAPPLREKLKLQLEDWFKDEVIEPFTLIIPLTLFLLRVGQFDPPCSFFYITQKVLV